MNTISAQKLLNGRFDEQFIIEKACRELERAKKCSDIFEMYDHIINFSISVSMIADWIFHLKLAYKDIWKNKNETFFTNWIRLQNPEVAALIDISNECKHAHRKHPSFFVENLNIKIIFDVSKTLQSEYELLINKGFSKTTDTGNVMLFFPTITYARNEVFFFDLADQAMAWWKDLNLDSAFPVNNKLISC